MENLKDTMSHHEICADDANMIIMQLKKKYDDCLPEVAIVEDFFVQCIDRKLTWETLALNIVEKEKTMPLDELEHEQIMKLRIIFRETFLSIQDTIKTLKDHEA